MQSNKGVYVDGSWQQINSASSELYNPSNGQVIAQVAQADAAVTQQAIEAARASFDERRWTQLSPDQRCQILWRIAELIQQNSEELAWLESVNTGKPYQSCLQGEIPFAAQCFRYYAGWIGKVDGAKRDLNGAPTDQFHAYSRLEPIGVAALIVPWNGPLVQTAWKLAPALAAGCSCILKPAELTPLTALRLAELVHEAGVPAGVVNIVTGRGSIVGTKLASSDLVDKVSFTGSTATGRKILQAAGANFKKLTLELGGKSPMFIFADADQEKAINGICDAIFSNAGQVCVAGSRVYIEEPIYDRVIEGVCAKALSLKVSTNFDPDVQMGPLISGHQLNSVLRWVKQGIDAGATLACGGQRLDRPGYFMQPTVFTDVDQTMEIVQEEIFGPVLCAAKFNGTAQAIELANDNIYGLAASIWTADIEKSNLLSASIKAGLVWVNCHGIPDMNIPFGGFKQSGWGRENGYEGLTQYMQSKSIIVGS